LERAFTFLKLFEALEGNFELIWRAEGSGVIEHPHS
jgi:hypothetical protein